MDAQRKRDAARGIRGALTLGASEPRASKAAAPRLAISWPAVLAIWCSLFFLAGLFCASRLPPPHPIWSLAWLASYGLIHALTLSSLLLALAGAATLPLRGAARRGVVGVAAAGLIFFVATDSFAFGVVGFHIDLNSIGYAIQDRAMTTLGLHAWDFVLVGALVTIGGVAGALAAPRIALRPVLSLLGVCLLLDAACSCANAVFRYRALQPLLGLAEAMPLAWTPRFEGLLFRIFQAPPQTTDDEALFPKPCSRDLSRRTLRTLPLPTRAARTPDILVVAVESLRADALAEMPRLAGLARSALVAERHDSSGNCTFEGVFSLLTGLEVDYWGARETWRAPRGVGALASLGYSLEIRQGMATDFNMFSRAFPPGAGRLLPSLQGSAPTRDDESAAWAAQWLASRGRQPRFAFVFLESTHWPYYSRGQTEWLGMVDSWARLDLEGHMRERYRDALRETDARLGRIIDARAAAPRGDDTVLVITGDHGEAFREHGVFAHGGRLDEEDSRPVLPGAAGRPRRDNPGDEPAPGPDADAARLPGRGAAQPQRRAGRRSAARRGARGAAAGGQLRHPLVARLCRAGRRGQGALADRRLRRTPGGRDRSWRSAAQRGADRRRARGAARSRSGGCGGAALPTRERATAAGRHWREALMIRFQRVHELAPVLAPIAAVLLLGLGSVAEAAETLCRAASGRVLLLHRSGKAALDLPPQRRGDSIASKAGRSGARISPRAPRRRSRACEEPLSRRGGYGAAVDGRGGGAT